MCTQEAGIGERVPWCRRATHSNMKPLRCRNCLNSFFLRQSQAQTCILCVTRILRWPNLVTLQNRHYMNRCCSLLKLEYHRYSATMAIEVLPVKESDLPTFERIHSNAFAGGLSKFLNPYPAASEELFIQLLREQMRNNTSVRLLKAVDTTTGETIACAKWHHYSIDRTDEEVAEASKRPPPIPGANPDAWNDLFGHIEHVRCTYMKGQKCWRRFIETSVSF